MSRSGNRLCLAALIMGNVLGLAPASHAQFVETEWTVTGYVGELWYADQGDFLGKKQEFQDGYASGVFYSCDYAGQSYTYNTYSPDEFLANREFMLGGQQDLFVKLFKEHGLSIDGNDVFVHRITCNGTGVFDRKVMYPFVTVGKSKLGFYVFEGAIFTLEFDH